MIDGAGEIPAAASAPQPEAMPPRVAATAAISQPEPPSATTAPASGQSPSEADDLEAVIQRLKARGIAVEDLRPAGGDLWVRATAAKGDGLLGRLDAWLSSQPQLDEADRVLIEGQGFRYKPGKGWWLKS